MKAIFSQWTKPMSLNHSLNIGFFEEETYLWSWALAVELANEMFDEVELYCDTPSREVLVRELALPFTRVHTMFDDLEMSPAFWTYGKFLAYSRQTAPFIHLDSDLFLYKQLHQRDLSSPFLFWASEDNLEVNYPLYKYSIDFVLNAPNPPSLLLSEGSRMYSSVNAGLFLVNDIDALHDYLALVFDFCHDPDNLAYLHEKSDGIIALCVDQYLLRRFLIQRGINFRVLINGERERNLELFEKSGNFHYLGRLKHLRRAELIARAKKYCGKKYSEVIARLCDSHIRVEM